MGLLEKINQKQQIKISSNYNTVLDDIYNLVKKQGCVKINFIADEFNLPIKQIEEWALIMEKNNLMNIHYPIVGKPELRNINFKK